MGGVNVSKTLSVKDEELLGKYKVIMGAVMEALDVNPMSPDEVNRIEKIMLDKYAGNPLAPVALGNVRLLRVAVEEHHRTVTASIKPRIMILQGRN